MTSSYLPSLLGVAAIALVGAMLFFRKNENLSQLPTGQADEPPFITGKGKPVIVSMRAEEEHRLATDRVSFWTLPGKRGEVKVYNVSSPNAPERIEMAIDYPVRSFEINLHGWLLFIYREDGSILFRTYSSKTKASAMDVMTEYPEIAKSLRDTNVKKRLVLHRISDYYHMA